jgi:serine/threonine protein kinase
MLALVKEHPRFMQGFSVMDSVGNIVRIIDYIPGMTMLEYIADLGKDHEEYFYTYFPEILKDYIELVDAIKFLHDHNEKHGDIRIEHIIRDESNGGYRWIDFDVNYIHRGNMFICDLSGLMNILVCLAGRGDVTTDQIRHYDPAVYSRLSSDDLHIDFGNSITNLKKVYQHIPEKLNRIFMRLSAGGCNFYDNTSEFLDDLREAGSYLWE